MNEMCKSERRTRHYGIEDGSSVDECLTAASTSIWKGVHIRMLKLEMFVMFILRTSVEDQTGTSLPPHEVNCLDTSKDPPLFSGLRVVGLMPASRRRRGTVGPFTVEGCSRSLPKFPKMFVLDANPSSRTCSSARVHSLKQLYEGSACNAGIRPLSADTFHKRDPIL